MVDGPFSLSDDKLEVVLGVHDYPLSSMSAADSHARDTIALS